MKYLATISKLLFGVLLLFAFTNTAAIGQHVIDEELRDGALPDGWTEINMDFRTGAGGYALFEEEDSELWTPSFDLSGLTEAVLTFQVAKFGSGDDGPLTVEVSVDGGDTWSAQSYESPVPSGSDYLAAEMEFDESVLGEEDVMIRFIRTDSPSAKRLRDIVVGEPAPIVEVNNLSELRTSDADGFTRYHLTGEVVIVHYDSFNNRRYLVDGGAGIFSVDSSGELDGGTTVGDGITGLMGTLSLENNGAVLQFTLDDGSADAEITSTENEITPESTTIADLSLDDTGKLVLIEGLTFQDEGEFETGTNYTVEDGDGNTLTFRTDYFSADYIEETIPTGTFDVIGVVGGFGDSPQIFARGSADFLFEFGPFELTSPEDNADLLVEGLLNDEVTISWTEAEALVPVHYIFHLDAAGGDFSDPVLSIDSNEGGTATELTLSFAQLDNLLESNELEVGDVFNGIWTVEASAGVYGSEFAEPFAINIERGEVEAADIGWANLQWPADMDLESNQVDTAYAKIWVEDLTGSGEESSIISAWFGIHDEDIDPADWPEDAWNEAEFNVSDGNDDEYMGQISMTEPGTYYYTSRFQIDGGEAVYGGFSDDGGGFWDGTDNVSGVLTVTPVEVENLAELRAGEIGGTIYRVSNEVVLTFNSDFRGRKAVSDATAGIVFDDFSGVIETEYNRYDGITGITGSLAEFNGLIQFEPSEDPGEASSTDNSVYPIKVNIGDLDFEEEVSSVTGQLVILKNVTVQETGDWSNQTTYELEDEDGNTLNLRTDRLDPGGDEAIYYQGEAPFIGTQIPDGPVNIVGYMTQFNSLQIVPRIASDITPADAIAEFDLENPENETTLVVEGEGSDTITIDWTEAESDDEVTYSWIAASPLTTYAIPSLELSSATPSLTLSNEAIDGLLAQFGVEVGGSIPLQWTVVARTENGIQYANQVWTVSLERGVVTSLDEAISDLPQQFELNQNYPNPFNPTTQIEYALPQASDVQISIYNVVGQRVALLVNNEQQSAGYHTVSFDASNLASGMYLYRIQAGNFIQTRKMTLIK